MQNTLIYTLLLFLYSPFSFAFSVNVAPDAGEALVQFGNELNSGTFVNAQFSSESGGSPSKVGGARDKTVTAFIPVDLDITSDADLTSLHSLISGVANNTIELPAVNSAISATDDGLVRFFLNIDNSDTASIQYLYFAVEDPNDTDKEDYNVVQTSPFTIVAANAAAFDSQIQVNLTAICLAVTECQNMIDGSATEDTEELIVYAYLHTDNSNADFKIAERPGGVFFTLNLSNKVSTIAANTPSMSQLRKGDEQLKAVFEGDTINDFFRTVFISYPSSQSALTPLAALTTAGANGTITVLENTITVSDGEANIKNLVNDTPYNFSVVYQDKYQFATNVSASLTETPESIDAFLQKNACFLISAGFLEDHYVLDFLRKFRDDILAHNAFGKMFIAWYYDTAPKYALIIAQHDSLRWVFRQVGFFFYYALKYFPLFILGALCLGYLVFFERRSPKKLRYES